MVQLERIHFHDTQKTAHRSPASYERKSADDSRDGATVVDIPVIVHVTAAAILYTSSLISV